MTTNEERDIILKALYYDFGKGHRINSDRLKDHVVSTYQMSDSRFYTILDDLHNNGYVERILFAQVQEFYITIKGEELIDEYKGFVGKALGEKQATFQFNNSPVTGSQIGNQGRDFLLDGKAATTITGTIATKNTAPTDKSEGETKNSANFWNTLIGKIIIGVIIAVLAFAITYPIGRAIDEKYNPKSTKTIKKS